MRTCKICNGDTTDTGTCITNDCSEFYRRIVSTARRPSDLFVAGTVKMKSADGKRLLDPDAWFAQELAANRIALDEVTVERNKLAEMFADRAAESAAYVRAKASLPKYKTYEMLSGPHEE